MTGRSELNGDVAQHTRRASKMRIKQKIIASNEWNDNEEDDGNYDDCDGGGGGGGSETKTKEENSIN